MSGSAGYYRVMLGDFEITAISDGTVALPVDKLLTNTQRSKHSRLAEPFEFTFANFRECRPVNTGSKLVLIDTGAGALFGPT